MTIIAEIIQLGRPDIAEVIREARDTLVKVEAELFLLTATDDVSPTVYESVRSTLLRLKS